jgi:hypothetical protein
MFSPLSLVMVIQTRVGGSLMEIFETAYLSSKKLSDREN